MRYSYVFPILAVLGLGMARPALTEETVNGLVYIVIYFDVAPTATAQSLAVSRQHAEAARKQDGNAEFEIFEEIGRPRFATLEAWRDKKADDAYSKGVIATAFRDKLQPLTIGGFGVRPHSGLAVATATTRLPPGAICVLTHVDVFPTFKDQAVELVKAQAEAARNDPGNLRYDVLQWDGHPNHFTLVEVWRDRETFDASVVAPHNKEFRQKLTPLEGALYDQRLYQAVR
jgi:quinol monooxygenase YgiN